MVSDRDKQEEEEVGSMWRGPLGRGDQDDGSGEASTRERKPQRNGIGKGLKGQGQPECGWT